MTTAAQPFRIAVGLTCGVTCAVLAVCVGHFLAISPFAWDWLMMPTAPAPLLSRPVGAVLVLDVVKLAWVGASAAAVLVRLREDRLRGLHVALVILLGNATVQLLKHWPHAPPVFLDGLEPLSGHAALVGAVTLAWVVTAPRDKRQCAGYVALASIILTCLAAVVLGLHSPLQVACPLVICLGWSLALVVIHPAHHRGPKEGPHQMGEGLALVGVVLVLLSLGLPTILPTTFGSSIFGVSVVLVASFVMGSALVVVGVAVARRGLQAGPPHRSSPHPCPQRDVLGHRRLDKPRAC
jgi:hypothetical protein